MHFTSPEELEQLIGEIKAAAKTAEISKQMTRRIKPGRTTIFLLNDKGDPAPSSLCRINEFSPPCCCSC